MIFVIALMVMFISIICCIKIKKPTVRVILGMVAFFNILIMILAGSFHQMENMNYYSSR